MIIYHTILRVVTIVLATIAGGAMCGFAAATSMTSGLFGIEGAIIGGVVGLVSSIGTAPLHWQKNLGFSLPIAFAPALIAALVLGMINPLLALAGSVIALMLTSAVTYFALNEVFPARDPHLCERCGYDLRGLPGTTCPECGTAASSASPASSPPPPRSSP